jgi:RNA polymerase sigma-70 factor (ECF subfamily)
LPGSDGEPPRNTYYGAGTFRLLLHLTVSAAPYSQGPSMNVETAGLALSTKDISDSVLVARARQRDEAAVRALMGRYNRRVYRIARSVVRDDSEAEDVVQDAYVRAFTHLDKFRGEASFATWLTRIVYNTALGRLRGRRPMVELEALDQMRPTDAQIIPFPLMSQDPERTMAQREIQQLLQRAIDELPEAFRTVLMMRLVEGLSVEETATVLGLRPETVKTRLHRARRLLHAALDEHIAPELNDAFPFAGARCERITDVVVRRLGYSK